MKTFDNEDLVNKYIDNELTEEELIEFNHRLETDPDFAEMLKDYEETDWVISKTAHYVKEKEMNEFMAGYDKFLEEQSKIAKEELKKRKQADTLVPELEKTTVIAEKTKNEGAKEIPLWGRVKYWVAVAAIVVPIFFIGFFVDIIFNSNPTKDKLLAKLDSLERNSKDKDTIFMKYKDSIAYLLLTPNHSFTADGYVLREEHEILKSKYDKIKKENIAYNAFNNVSYDLLAKTSPEADASSIDLEILHPTAKIKEYYFSAFQKGETVCFEWKKIESFSFCIKDEKDINVIEYKGPKNYYYYKFDKNNTYYIWELNKTGKSKKGIIYIY